MDHRAKAIVDYLLLTSTAVELLSSVQALHSITSSHLSTLEAAVERVRIAVQRCAHAHRDDPNTEVAVR